VLHAFAGHLETTARISFLARIRESVVLWRKAGSGVIEIERNSPESALANKNFGRLSSKQPEIYMATTGKSDLASMQTVCFK
jgi:hypothetical protein